MKKVERSYIREILDAINEHTISFAGGLPNEKLFPTKKIEKASKKVLKDPNSLQYSKSKGIDSLREKIAALYTEYFDFPTTKDEILITTGSQQTFDIIGKAFIEKNVVVQNPTYLGALGAFKVLDLHIKSFDNLDELEGCLDEKSGFYTISDFSNPSATRFNKKQREKIAEAVNKENAFLIEDGAYSFLDFEGDIQKPIASKCEKSFHLGSFSKIVAPGLRVGWIRAKKEFLEDILASKEALDLHTPTFTQMVLDSYLEDNDLFEHIKKVRENYKGRMEYMAECFEKYIPSFKFKKPKGGMFIYGSFDVDSFILAKEALKHNVAFVPGSVFFNDGRISKEARFNFSNSTKKQIKKGVKQLASLL